ncbi:MAG: MerR family transcriptional regulator [Chloroflexota bacterium]
MLTIGQLAKRVGLRSSALRFYEGEGLLVPNGRSEAGYRLYDETAEERLRLIQRAQRLGFSLADIRTLLAGWDADNLSDEALLETAEKRYLALEKQVTQLLVLQHELALFLHDLQGTDEAPSAHSFPNHSHLLDELLSRVCANPIGQANTEAMLNWLLQRTQCQLTTDAAQAALEELRGEHIHIWQEEGSYFVLVVSQETAVANGNVANGNVSNARVANALRTLSQLEGDCEAHDDPVPELTYNDEGYLLTIRGDNAFLLARLFLSLNE